MRKKIYWAIGVVVSILALMYGLNTSTKVDTITVGKDNIQHMLVDTGYVQAAEQFDLYAQQMARVSDIPVSLGQSIEKEQVIMVLENLDLSMSSNQLQIQLSQAKAALTSAEAALERSRLDVADTQTKFYRAQELFDAGAISKAEYDETRSLLDKYQKGLTEQTKNLLTSREQVNSYQQLLTSSKQKEAELLVKSPIAGTLLQIPVKREQVVAQGTLLARVALASTLEIKADLLSDDLGEVKIGQKVQVTAPVLGETVLTGEVIKIYPQAEEKQSALGVIQRRVPVIIALESNGNLKPGYETRISIATASKEDVLIVPREAIFSNTSNQKQVMLIVNGKLVFREVKTGLADSKNIEILEGLNPGDIIAKDASVSLKENTRVK